MSHSQSCNKLRQNTAGASDKPDICEGFTNFWFTFYNGGLWKKYLKAYLNNRYICLKVIIYCWLVRVSLLITTGGGLLTSCPKRCWDHFGSFVIIRPGLSCIRWLEFVYTEWMLWFHFAVSSSFAVTSFLDIILQRHNISRQHLNCVHDVILFYIEPTYIGIFPVYPMMLLIFTDY